MNILKHKLPYLFLIALLITGCKSDTKTTASVDQQKQNILFIAIDDLRPKINSYGETKMITPNIDQLAREGVQFNNAFTNIAVCGASRLSLIHI